MNRVKGRRKEMTARAGSEANNLAIYLREISHIPMLSRDEEIRTAREAAAGSKGAREKLVSANLRFVVHAAKKYQGLGLPLEDLINEGNVGLLNAVDRFDVDKGYHIVSCVELQIFTYIINCISRYRGRVLNHHGRHCLSGDDLVR